MRKTAGQGGPPPGTPATGRPRRSTLRRSLGLAAAGVVLALLAAACSGGGSSGSGGTSAYLKWAPCCSWATTWSLNQYSPVALTIGEGLVQLPLAVEDDPSLTSFTPQLASSWSVKGDTLTIHLRPGVKWQNGKPVTSTDVYDTLVLDGLGGSGGATAAAGTAGWLYISSMTVPNSSEVVVSTRPGTDMTLLEDQLLAQTIYPASTYGRFVTPVLERDAIAYYGEDLKSPTAAAKMPQYAAMQAAFKKLSAYSVPKLIGDGPFELKAVNTAEALMVKWPGFYDAASIHVPGIDYLNDQNQGIYPLLFGGQADFSNVYMSPAILKRWQSTTGSHTAIPRGFTFDLVFNSHEYPLNMTAVRQAIAYVIPRANMVASAYGGSSVKDRGGVVNEYSDGLPSYLTPLYLTPGQISSLNTYPVNEAKAASLLQSAGFHKSGSTWTMPNGKPFTLSFLVNSATSDIVSSFDQAASALSAFGIHSSLDATQGTIQADDVFKGNFQVSVNLVGGPNPLYNNIDWMLGTLANFETLGNYAGDRGLGFGPTETVPGLGKVDVPSTLDRESKLVGPGKQMNKLVYDWARLVNQQVPLITYATKVYQFPYSSQHFTDWPPMNSQGTSALWNILGQGNMTQGLTLMLEHGYIRPKS